MAESNRHRSSFLEYLLLFGALVALAPGCSVAALRDAEQVAPEGWSRFYLASTPSNAVGVFGIFDPSFARSSDRNSVSRSTAIYMAYSAISPSYRWPTKHPHVVQTRLAVSKDGGEVFTGISNRANAAFDDPDQNLVEPALFGGPIAVTWQHEVPSLVYVPAAIASERWQLFWHQYPLIDGDRRFEFGWIAHKAAARPEELYAKRATKLFTGGGYSTRADSYDGTARVALNELHGDLVGCVALTEPGAFVFEGRFFLAVHCADGQMPANGRIVLLEQAHGAWKYRGTLLDNERDAMALGGGDRDFTGFSAPNLFRVPVTGQVYLAVTLTRPEKTPAYQGCMIFRVVDLVTARLERDNAVPRMAAVSNGDPEHHNGACAYLNAAGLAASLIQGQVYPDSVDRFRLYRTEVRL